MNNLKYPCKIIRVVVPSGIGLRNIYDYLPPENCEWSDIASKLLFGVRVYVPFGSRNLVGFVVGQQDFTEIPLSRLKPITQILDTEPLWQESTLRLLQWVSDYYHYPLGEVFAQVLPPTLRNFKIPKRKKKSKDLANIKQEQLDFVSNDANVIDNNANKSDNDILQNTTSLNYIAQNRVFNLNQHQQEAIEIICNTQGFKTFLLDGVTGSGKTEVYLSVIAEILSQGKQALILVPEINLTPQTIERFQSRFATKIAIIHSKLTPQERLQYWLESRNNEAKLIIGTRSAIFTPLSNSGIIIIDEEHDSSFKQQNNLRYSARDLAIMRGKIENIPVVLGSATPSLESYYNVWNKRYTHLILPIRAGNASQPTFHLIDMRNQKLQDGLANGLIKAIDKHLNNSGQVLIFLNRRGYAPVLLCNSCGWIADCKHCDAHLTLHRKEQKLFCHHCGASQNIPETCESCHKKSLYAMGLGTEKLEKIVTKLFPGIISVRIDRDTTNKKGSIDTMLESIHNGTSQILLGTQMLAKGHHFPNVTMVAILNADNGLFSPDFRSCERLAQLIMQVSGRAGRAEKTGEVYIQTHYPNNPLLQRLIQHGYNCFAQASMKERQETKLPPYSFLALWHAEAKDVNLATEFLQNIKEYSQQFLHKFVTNQKNTINISGPIPANLERKAGFYQMNLLYQSHNRQHLQQMLKITMQYVTTQKINPKIRWSLDVDPLEV